jgi:hypothetical protein
LYLEHRTNMDGGDYYPNPGIGTREHGERYAPLPRGDWEVSAT